MQSALKMPQALSGPEIKEGIRAFVIKEGVPEFIADEIRKGLNNTCLLNAAAYSKFRAEWKVVAGQWRVDYDLDDYGRIHKGMMNGRLPQEFEEFDMSGVIEPMPPDKFRRESEQKIPIPNIIQPKGDESHSMGKSLRGRGKVRDL